MTEDKKEIKGIKLTPPPELLARAISKYFLPAYIEQLREDQEEEERRNTEGERKSN